jgi:hypothetical protein
MHSRTAWKVCWDGTIVSGGLTPFEREVYELIKKSGDILTTDVPVRMRGAVPHLINKGLVETFKRTTSPWTTKKKKFLRSKDT